MRRHANEQFVQINLRSAGHYLRKQRVVERGGALVDVLPQEGLREVALRTGVEKKRLVRAGNFPCQIESQRAFADAPSEIRDRIRLEAGLWSRNLLSVSDHLETFEQRVEVGWHCHFSE